MREPSRCVNRFAESKAYRFHPQPIRAAGAWAPSCDHRRFGADENRLAARRRLAPQRRPIAVAGMHGEDLVAHPEGRDLPGLLLDGFRQGEADLAQTKLGGGAHASAISGNSGSSVPPASATRTGAKER